MGNVPVSQRRENSTATYSIDGGPETSFDVPGLFNQIWADGNGVACEDTGVMAGW